MLRLHRLSPGARVMVFKLMILAGLIRLGFVFWAAWRDNVKHDHARADFVADCEAKEAASTCAHYVEARDKACFFKSGLSSAQAGSEADYQRCMWVGRAAYLKERAARYSAQHNRYKDIMD